MAGRDERAEQERLVKFNRTASRIGACGACGHCRVSVDIGVIPTADCPHCDRRFVDIELASSRFGTGTDTLVTAGDSGPAGVE